MTQPQLQIQTPRTVGRKVSLTIAVFAAAMLVGVVVDLLTGGFGMGLIELALIWVVIIAGLVRVWWPRRHRP
jgi:hypothetical protein